MLTSEQMELIRDLLGVSVVFACLPVAVAFVRWVAVRLPLGSHRHYRGKGTAVFYICLLVSVWLSRLALGYYEITIAVGDAKLGQWEMVLNSFTRALQTFGLAENYETVITRGRVMATAVFSEGSVWVGRFGVYTAVMNVVVPVAGGAFVFDMLANIFPKLALYASHLVFWKEKHYFSELDARSLALAKSIRAAERKRLLSGVIVFCDVYADKWEEKESELLQEAKDIGAICLRDDIIHVRKNINGGRSTYYLIDQKDGENLQALVALSRLPFLAGMRKAKVYLFSHGDSYVQLEQQLQQQLNKRDMTVIPVQSYRNLAMNLLVELPLYEPLVGKKDTKQLNVTILGNGSIGTEMFLAVYWIGQMLDCRLNIHVVSQDSREDFWEKIDYINPEIRHTCTENHHILQYRKGSFAQPYAYVSYTQSDVRLGAFWKMEEPQAQRLMDTDYFIVALGSDAVNMNIAEKLRQCIGQRHAEAGGDGKRTVIAYAVYQSELCQCLNMQKRYCSYDKEKADIYMHAFGSLHQEYAIENIAMTEHQVLAQEIGQAYLHARQKSEQIADNRKRATNADKEYAHWADIARAMHLKYKVFSLGWITTSVFDKDSAAHAEGVQRACALYRGAAIGCKNVDSQSARQMEENRDRLAWLEHRRWCAFTRVKGFRSTDAYAQYYDATGSYKHMSLKLHPCLRECSDTGMQQLIDGNRTLHPEAAVDALDALTCELYGKYNDYDFKQYDYPEHAFSFVSEATAMKKLNMEETALRTLCRRRRISGAERFMDTEEWMIPTHQIKRLQKKKPKNQAEKAKSEAK